MTVKEIVLYLLLGLIGLGILKAAAVAERLEPKVSQAFDDAHEAQKQIPALIQMGNNIAESIKGFRVFRQEEQRRR